ncbi:predicted protein [Botrytis cinerea T4]|uniref:Uncharacterized protein n=1 Tax=Botryotinia fuckeliana (strain T4) TaxID=999810 RepID=G2Y704_BOTF4|nr:predicted protein [Botrytis cinerea T4]
MSTPPCEQAWSRALDCVPPVYPVSYISTETWPCTEVRASTAVSHNMMVCQQYDPVAKSEGIPRKYMPGT